jgi:hypothetical protein
MANEFVARKGIIVLENGAIITGSSTISGSLSVVNGVVSSSGFSGSGAGLTDIAADSIQYENILGKPALVSASSQIDHNATTNYVANQHVDHTTVNINAGDGLSGGGNISASRTLTLDTSSAHFISGARSTVTFEDTTGSSGIDFTYTNGTVSAVLQSSSITVNGTEISLGSSGTVTANTTNALTLGDGLTGTSFNGSAAVTTTVDTGSTHFTGGVKTKLNADGVYSSSAQVVSSLPAGTVSASSQIDHDATTNFVADEHVAHSTVEITAGSGLSGGGNITATRTLTLDTSSAHFTGGVKTKLNADGVFSSSAQVSYTGLSDIPSGIVSSSGQVTALLPAGTVSASSQIIASDVTGIGNYAQLTGSNTFTAAQTISDTTNSTSFLTGALVVAGGVGIGKDVNISGSVNITGLLTVTSMSTQYVTSSQFTVGTSRIVLNDNDLVRFAGMTIIDSGSTAASASILWDSLTNRFIYETDDIDGGNTTLHSAVLLAGPETYAEPGNEVGLVEGRVPVATTEHNLDNRVESSSIRIDFPSRLTHIEAGLFVTGAISSSVGFSGDGSGLTSITASSVAFDDVTGKPTLISASIQVDHNATTNYVANQHIDHSAVEITAGLGLSGGGNITATRTVTLDTGSAHFTGGVKTKLNADGVFSSSAQVSYTGISDVPAGIVSSSTQFTSATDPFTGSFSGSFFGDASGLTGIASTLAISGSTSGTGTISLNTEGLIVSGTNGITSTVSSQTVTLSGVDATTTVKGVASFNTDNFTVSTGAVSSKGITINGTSVNLGGTRNITLQDITTAGASTTTATTFSTSATINNTLISGSVVSSIAGPVTNQVVASVPTGSFDAVHFDYVVKDGTNFRTGTVMAVTDGTNVQFTDTSTADIGDTLGANFEVDLSGGNIRLKFTVVTGTWTVKSSIRAF